MPTIKTALHPTLSCLRFTEDGKVFRHEGKGLRELKLRSHTSSNSARVFYETIIDGRRYRKSLAHSMLEAFDVPKPKGVKPHRLRADFINGKEEYRLSNLRWADASELPSLKKASKPKPEDLI